MVNYFIITKRDEVVDGVLLQTGPNFCSPKVSGFRILTKKSIGEHYGEGVYVRKVTFPTNDPDFYIIPCNQQFEYYANHIILDCRYSLDHWRTYEELEIPFPSIYKIGSGGFLNLAKELFTSFDEYAKSNRMTPFYWYGQRKIPYFDMIDIPKAKNKMFVSGAMHGHVDICLYLLKIGADVNYDSSSFTSPAMHGDLNMVTFLVNNGVEIDADDGAALRNAVRLCRIDIIVFLVSAGANVNVVKKGDLENAIKFKRSDVIDLFSYLL